MLGDLARGKQILFWCVLGSVIVPTTALAIPTYLMFSRLGITNTPIAVILPSLVSPFGIYLMRIYAKSAVPSELIEAARLDGASEWRIFHEFAFRLLVPGFVRDVGVQHRDLWLARLDPAADPRLRAASTPLARQRSLHASAGT